MIFIPRGCLPGKPEMHYQAADRLLPRKTIKTNAGARLSLLEITGLCQPEHDIEMFHALRLACPDDFVFFDLALGGDFKFIRELFSEYGAQLPML